MFEVGRICVKLAGRDAGKKCVVVDLEKDGFVIIDGQTRRRKCNPKHLEPTKQLIELKKGSSHEEVKKAFEKLNIELKDTKPKQTPARPKKSKKQKVYEPKPQKKKAAKPVKTLEAQAEVVAQEQSQDKPATAKKVVVKKDSSEEKPQTKRKIVVKKASDEEKQSEK